MPYGYSDAQWAQIAQDSPDSASNIVDNYNKGNAMSTTGRDQNGAAYNYTDPNAGTQLGAMANTAIQNGAGAAYQNFVAPAAQKAQAASQPMPYGAGYANGQPPQAQPTYDSNQQQWQQLYGMAQNAPDYYGKTQFQTMANPFTGAAADQFKATQGANIADQAAHARQQIQADSALNGWSGDSGLGQNAMLQNRLGEAANRSAAYDATNNDFFTKGAAFDQGQQQQQNAFNQWKAGGQQGAWQQRFGDLAGLNDQAYSRSVQNQFIPGQLTQQQQQIQGTGYNLDATGQTQAGRIGAMNAGYGYDTANAGAMTTGVNQAAADAASPMGQASRYMQQFTNLYNASPAPGLIKTAGAIGGAMLGDPMALSGFGAQPTGKSGSPINMSGGQQGSYGYGGAPMTGRYNGGDVSYGGGASLGGGMRVPFAPPAYGYGGY